ncbi:hypothetical protein D1872_272020 [compost metagenome]
MLKDSRVWFPFPEASRDDNVIKVRRQLRNTIQLLLLKGRTAVRQQKQLELAILQLFQNCEGLLIYVRT